MASLENLFKKSEVVSKVEVGSVSAFVFLESLVISCKKHQNGRHGGGHGKGRGSERFDRHGPSGKKGIDHLPPEKRPARHREQHDGNGKKRKH